MSAAVASSRGRRPWTLRRTLVVGITALVVVVLAVLGVVSVLTLRASVTTVVDTQLTGSMSALQHSVEKFRDGKAVPGTAPTDAEPTDAAATDAGTTGSGTTGTGAGTDGQPGKGGYQKALVDFVGHGPGSIIALVQDGEVIDSARFTGSDAVVLDRAVITQIEAAIADDTTDGADGAAGDSARDGAAGDASGASSDAVSSELIAAGAAANETRENVVLDGLGAYRLATVPGDDPGEVLVTGVSLATADAAVLRQTIVVLALSLLAVALVIVGTIVVVRLALRPLGRVVSTAQDVTTMQLDRGEVAITPRVDGHDTDPRTEVGKVGEALNRLLAHVDDALAVRAATDKRMRRFVTDASHELRTPLAAIQGYAELTRQDSAELPQMTEYSLARIESEAARMSSLVSDLLLLARLDEGQDLHTDDVDLSDLVVNAVNDASAAAPSHSFLVDIPDSTVFVHGDRERLHQVVVNLLSNAAVHTPAGTNVVTSLRVATGAGAGAESGVGVGHGAGSAAGSAAGALGGRASDGLVELAISDDGQGIAPELLPELFERFARGDASRARTAGGAVATGRAGSTGLGLAIVASIVEAHHGTIRVESTLEVGTTFRVLLSTIVPTRPFPTSPVPVVTPPRGIATRP